MRILNYTIFSFVLLILICVITTSVSAKSGTSKWTQYADPYGRYSLEYPSKWIIETEAVHRDGNYLNEIPLKLSSHGSILIARDMDSTNLTLKEYASYYLENVDQGISSGVMNPISCGYMSAQPVESCHYGLVTTVGDSAIGTWVQLYKGFRTDNKVYVLTLMLSESSASKNVINHILDSFRIVGEPINVYHRDAAQKPYGDFIPSCSGDYYHPC